MTEPKDRTLTLADITRAVQTLRSQKIPTFPGGVYRMHINPAEAEAIDRDFDETRRSEVRKFAERLAPGTGKARATLSSKRDFLATVTAPRVNRDRVWSECAGKPPSSNRRALVVRVTTSELDDALHAAHSLGGLEAVDQLIQSWGPTSECEVLAQTDGSVWVSRV
jgi:hypothetical protein